jgi:hypothetical protein
MLSRPRREVGPNHPHSAETRSAVFLRGQTGSGPAAQQVGDWLGGREVEL